MLSAATVYIMAQPPTNPTVPYARSVSADMNTGNLPAVVPTETGVANAESNVPSTTAPITPGIGIGGIDLDPTKKRNTSFKITGILPSRPPSNSDDDDVDDSTVTEDDVPDIVPIHEDSAAAGNGVNDMGTDTSTPNVGNVEANTIKQPSNTNLEQKQTSQSQQIASESSSNVPLSVAIAVTSPALPSNVGQRRNSQQTDGGKKGSGVGGSGMLPSIRTAMALGYRFNIFVYDHKGQQLGKSSSIIE